MQLGSEKYLTDGLGKSIRVIEIGATTNVVHQLTSDKQSQRQRQPITNGSDEAKDHQHHIYTVRMHEDRPYGPPSSSSSILLLPHFALVLLH